MPQSEFNRTILATAAILLSVYAHAAEPADLSWPVRPSPALIDTVAPDLSSWRLNQWDYSFASDMRLDERAETNLFKLPLLGTLMDAGYRVSGSDGQNFDDLTRHAVFLDFSLPWSWTSAGGITAEPYLAVEVGQLMQGADARTFASFGPALRLTHDRWNSRMFVDVGLSPTVVDGSQFENEDLGTSLTFTSHLGLGLRFGKQRKHVVKLRYEHISNGGINNTNPGVNLVGIDVVLWAQQ